MNNFEIYVDLDGVLADFDSEFIRRFNIKPDDAPKKGVNGATKEDEKRHRRYYNYNILHGEFFYSLGVLPGSQHMMQELAQYNPSILSATGTMHVDIVRGHKSKWVNKHFSGVNLKQIILVQRSKDKAQYAHPNAILIDDRSKSIDPWVAAGGIGILHTSPENTLREIREIMDNDSVEESMGFDLERLKKLSGI